MFSEVLREHPWVVCSDCILLFWVFSDLCDVPSTLGRHLIHFSNFGAENPLDTCLTWKWARASDLEWMALVHIQWESLVVDFVTQRMLLIVLHENLWTLWTDQQGVSSILHCLFLCSYYQLRGINCECRTFWESGSPCIFRTWGIKHFWYQVGSRQLEWHSVSSVLGTYLCQLLGQWCFYFF